VKVTVTSTPKWSMRNENFHAFWQYTRMIAVTHLQDHAVVRGGFILAAVVLTQVNINMIQLQEANQVS